MKSPDLWNEDDLLQLIANRQEESIQLDFKRADALQQTDGKKKDEISKDVSAFANSTGGTIVYGIAESGGEPRVASGLSPIDPKEISKEWLDQVINSRIQPRVAGIIINPVELGTKDPGKFVYVVIIPQSTTAHQASDKKYYRRFSFQSVPMEDYEVRQTMNRASHPAYKATLARFQLHGAGQNRLNFRMQTQIENQSEIVGYDVSAVLFVPKDLLASPDDFEFSIGDIPYARIPGTYVDPATGRNVDRIATAQPLVPYVCNFLKDVSFSTEFSLGQQAKVFLQVYDRYGLALGVKFRLTLANPPRIDLEEIRVQRQHSLAAHFSEWA